MSLLGDQAGDDGLAAVVAGGAVVGCDRCGEALAAFGCECCGELFCPDCWADGERICQDCIGDDSGARPVENIRVRDVFL